MYGVRSSPAEGAPVHMANQPISSLGVSAQQLHVFAANVNDSRVISETAEFCERHGVDAHNVAALTFEPAGRKGRIAFQTYQVDEQGNRISIWADGVTYDPEADPREDVQLISATEVITKPLTGELPGWFDQAARVVVPTRQEMAG